MLTNETLFFAIFLAFVAFMLTLDLGILNKKNHEVSFKEAAAWSVLWVALAIGFYFFLIDFGYLVHGIESMEDLLAVQDRYHGKANYTIDNFAQGLQAYQQRMALEFITGYLIEYSLSVDNIFVIILIFASFGVRKVYYKKVLFLGILGAIVMRFIFIFLGAALIHNFHWIMYVFGVFLIFTGVKMFIDRNEDETIEPQKHPIVRFISRHFGLFPRYVGGQFFVKRKVDGKLLMTPLFVVVIIVEATDLLFAVDSVPAIFAVTEDPYVVFFSNIFAIMGLRSMFFFLANVMKYFHYLKVGLSALLVYIGLKMIFQEQLYEIGFKTSYSLYIILGILAVSIAASLLFPLKEDEIHLPTLPTEEEQEA